MEAARSVSTQQKQSDLALVPYVELGGRWTVSDDVLRGVFDRISEEGTLERVFYEGHISTAEHFLDMLKLPSNIPVVLFIDGKPIGFAWLNSQMGHIAFAHFCFLKSVWGAESESAGRLLANYWMSMADDEGPIFDVLIGVIPRFNELAIRFAQRVGFRLLGEIPGMSRLKSCHRMEAAILYYARQ